MTITRDNYEPFFLDFLEGKLDESQIDEFLLFLEGNQDLKEELQLFDCISLPNEQIVFEGKQQLYKSELDEKNVLDNKVVDYLEGMLTEEEEEAFEIFLTSHPEMRKEYDLFAKTRLIPDHGIKFPDKQKLYRKSGTVVLLNWVARVAAVGILLVGINSLYQSEWSPNKEIAVLSPKTGDLPEPKTITAVKKIETAEPAAKPETQQAIKTTPKIIREQTQGHFEEKLAVVDRISERDLTPLDEIKPLLAQLDAQAPENQLAVSHPVNVQKINDPQNIMNLQEFLASRAKRISSEGLLSANRFVRAGLGVASELSGDRIGYREKDGKISSLDFESKLLAFSIPVKKK